MKYLGIDFGLRRIGIATSEGELASPLKTIQVKGYKDGLEKVVEVIGTGGFDKIVVGLPEGKIGKTVLGFVKALKKMGLSVECSDETLSSKRALERMIELNIPKNKRRFNDEMAATIILQNWLDEKGS